MGGDERMNEPPAEREGPEGPEDSASPSTAPLDAGGRRRRRFVAGGTSAAVVMTLAGRPAWASSCTPSAIASANASGQHDYSTCRSKSAGYWKQLRGWPVDLRPDDEFHRWFPGQRFFSATEGRSLALGECINLVGGTYTSKCKLPGKKMQTLPGGPYANEANIGLHAVGALVNAYAFPLGSSHGDFGYTPQQIVDIYMKYSVAQAAAFFEHINNQFDF